MSWIIILLLTGACNTGDDSQRITSKVASADQQTNDEILSESLPSGPVVVKLPCEESMQPFKTLWKANAGDKITLPLPAGPPSYRYRFNIDWGDGTRGQVTSYDDPDISHTYRQASEEATGAGVHEGNYRLTITGLLEAWGSGDCSDNLVAVEDLGNTCLKSLKNAFRGCKKLTRVKGGNTSKVTDMSYAFYQAGTGSLELQINSWDTSKVRRMEQMFADSRVSFVCDQEIDDCEEANLKNWQTANVTNMSNMFRGLSTANPDLSNWQTNSLTSVERIFYGASGVNPDLSNWNFSKIKEFRDFIHESDINNDNYCNLIVSLNNSAPTNIPDTEGNKRISMSEHNCTDHQGFCEAKQALIDKGWTISDATTCP